MLRNLNAHATTVVNWFATKLMGCQLRKTLFQTHVFFFPSSLSEQNSVCSQKCSYMFITCNICMTSLRLTVNHNRLGVQQQHKTSLIRQLENSGQKVSMVHNTDSCMKSSWISHCYLWRKTNDIFVYPDVSTVQTLSDHHFFLSLVLIWWVFSKTTVHTFIQV